MEIEQNSKYLLNTLIGGLDKSSPYKNCGFDKSSPYIKNHPYLLMDVLKRQGKRIIFFLISSVVLSSNAFPDVKRNKTSIGFLIGDPVTLSLRVPIS